MKHIEHSCLWFDWCFNSIVKSQISQTNLWYKYYDLYIIFSTVMIFYKKNISEWEKVKVMKRNQKKPIKIVNRRDVDKLLYVDSVL